MDPERARREIRPEPATRWECRTCALDLGVATNTTVRVRIGGQVRVATGRMVGGSFHEVCACCLGRGKTTIAAPG